MQAASTFVPFSEYASIFGVEVITVNTFLAETFAFW